VKTLSRRFLSATVKSKTLQTAFSDLELCCALQVAPQRFDSMERFQRYSENCAAAHGTNFFGGANKKSPCYFSMESNSFWRMPVNPFTVHR
jgi:hypothetical protein